MPWEGLPRALHPPNLSNSACTSRFKLRSTLVYLLGMVVTFSVFRPLFLTSQPRPVSAQARAGEYLVQTIENFADYLIDYPLGNDQFGEMGRRVETLRNWLTIPEVPGSDLTSAQRRRIAIRTEKLVSSLFPFLPRNRSLLSRESDSFAHESRGIVVTTGVGTFRYACHLISCIRDVLHSNLPIRIVYAGDGDLPLSYRQTLMSLGNDIETLDILTIFNDTSLDLEHGSWAIKPFAILAARFQHVLLIDADAVFLQPPETIFDSHSGYRETGTLLFRDRLIYKGQSPERHAWWRKEMEHRQPSATFLKSLVHSEGYSEEGESGVVVVDKGRLPVLLGLLHICWQNSKSVREEWTYKMAWGDKESWWFGYELTGVPYTFEGHYAAIIGTPVNEGNVSEICAYTIAHIDKAGKLLWINGSLMKNKAVDTTEFAVPTHWMIDGVWIAGNGYGKLSCMTGATATFLDEVDSRIWRESVEVAKQVDRRLMREFPGVVG